MRYLIEDTDDSFDERGRLKDQHTLRTSMMMRDSAGKPLHGYTDLQAFADARKPGFVRSGDAAREQQRTARDAMYLDYDKSISEAWSKTPAEVDARDTTVDTMPASPPRTMSAADAQKIKDAAYKKYDENLRSSWRNK
jgi:hypothetical protein